MTIKIAMLNEGANVCIADIVNVELIVDESAKVVWNKYIIQKIRMQIKQKLSSGETVGKWHILDENQVSKWGSWNLLPSDDDEDDRLFSSQDMFNFALRVVLVGLENAVSGNMLIDGLSPEEYILRELNAEEGDGSYETWQKQPF